MNAVCFCVRFMIPLGWVSRTASPPTRPYHCPIKRPQKFLKLNHSFNQNPPMAPHSSPSRQRVQIPQPAIIRLQNGVHTPASLEPPGAPAWPCWLLIPNLSSDFSPCIEGTAFCSLPVLTFPTARSFHTISLVSSSRTPVPHSLASPPSLRTPTASVYSS